MAYRNLPPKVVDALSKLSVTDSIERAKADLERKIEESKKALDDLKKNRITKEEFDKKFGDMKNSIEASSKILQSTQKSVGLLNNQIDLFNGVLTAVSAALSALPPLVPGAIIANLSKILEKGKDLFTLLSNKVTSIMTAINGSGRSA